MSTALTIVELEPMLKQAIHLVSSEHQNSPHIVKMSSDSYLLFSHVYFFTLEKLITHSFAIWRHVLFAFYIALLG
jgi:hypothetical protein